MTNPTVGRINFGPNEEVKQGIRALTPQETMNYLVESEKRMLAAKAAGFKLGIEKAAKYLEAE